MGAPEIWAGLAGFMALAVAGFMATHPPAAPLAREETFAWPLSPDEAVERLGCLQCEQVDLHRHLDSTGTWRQAPDLLLEHVHAQLAEIEHLLRTGALDHPDLLPARRFRIACANAANYLAFLSAQAEVEPI